MGRYVVEARAHSGAPRERLWEVLADVPSWAEWGPWKSSAFEREGTPAPGGVGAVRLLKQFPLTLREEIVEFEPPERLVYRLLSWAPMHHYRAVVSLSDTGEGAEIHWRSQFQARPGIGGLLQAQLQKAFEDGTARLARAAESR